MPKQPEYPEHWKEEYYEEADGLTEDIEKIDLIDLDEKDLLTGEGTDRNDLIEMTDKEKTLDLELEREQQKYEKAQKTKATKTRISGKKREIRHLKYAPAYEAGSKLKEVGSKLKDVVDKKRGTDEQRQARREKTKTQMKKIAVMAKQKGIAFGKSMQENRSGKTPGAGLMGSGSKGFMQLGQPGKTYDLSSGSQKRLGMMGNAGTHMMDKNTNILGNTGSKLMGSNSMLSSKKKTAQTGSKMMSGNILGTATGKNKEKKNRLY